MTRAQIQTLRKRTLHAYRLGLPEFDGMMDQLARLYTHDAWWDKFNLWLEDNHPDRVPLTDAEIAEKAAYERNKKAKWVTAEQDRLNRLRDELLGL